MKISACLVIHNGEKLLPRCLESIKNIADEIIVVHDGPCSDKSLEIAQKFETKVFVRPFIGEAEYHRPFSFKKAKGDWILQIDADEFLSKKAKKEIPSLVQSRKVDAYSFLWLYFDGKNYIKKGPFGKILKPCLFRKEKLYMIGVSHDYPRTYGIFKERPDILLEHKPQYDNFTSEIFKKKWRKWAKLQAKQIYSIEKAPTFNIYKDVESKIFLYYGFMRRYPILSAVLAILKYIFIYLLRGLVFSGKKSWQIAYYNLLYLWLVRFYLLKLKYGRRI